MSMPGPIHVAVIDIGRADRRPRLHPRVRTPVRRRMDPRVPRWAAARKHGTAPMPRRASRASSSSGSSERGSERPGAAGLLHGTSRARPGHGRGPHRDVAARAAPELRPGLTELDHPDYEVIVVDNRPAGAPPVDLPGARVVRETRPGISAARNRGLAEATGEIVAFTDDDVEVDRRWLRALGERFARTPELAAVTGLVVPAELETPAQIFFEQSGSGLDRGYAPLTFERAGRFQIRRRDEHDGTERIQSLYEMGELGLGSNMAFRTDVLRAAGGFDEALGTGTPTRGGEDLAILVELLAGGHRLAYEPAAIVHHTHRATIDRPRAPDPRLRRRLHRDADGDRSAQTRATSWASRRSFRRGCAHCAIPLRPSAQTAPPISRRSWAEPSCAGCSRGPQRICGPAGCRGGGQRERDSPPAPVRRDSRPIKLATIDRRELPGVRSTAGLATAPCGRSSGSTTGPAG